MKSDRANLSQAKGMTLVELMVALVLGMMLVFGLVLVVQSNRQSIQLNQTLSNSQEIDRFVRSYFTHNIQNSGFAGCFSRDGRQIFQEKMYEAFSTRASISDFDNFSKSFDQMRAVSIYPVGQAPYKDNLELTNAEIGSSVLIFRRAVEKIEFDPGGLASVNNISGIRSLIGNQYTGNLVITDCKSMDMINLTQKGPLIDAFDTGRLEIYTFEISAVYQVNRQAQGDTPSYQSLYIARLSPNMQSWQQPEEMIRGVSGLAFQLEMMPSEYRQQNRLITTNTSMVASDYNPVSLRLAYAINTSVNKSASDSAIKQAEYQMFIKIRNN